MSRTGTENPAVHDHAACVEQAVSSAVALCGRQGLNLTPVRRRVLEIVWRSHGPIGAYQILAELSKYPVTTRVSLTGPMMPSRSSLPP